jgi:hypothetical protein
MQIANIGSTIEHVIETAMEQNFVPVVDDEYENTV